jgi:hypothetical protein
MLGARRAEFLHSAEFLQRLCQLEPWVRIQKHNFCRISICFDRGKLRRSKWLLDKFAPLELVRIRESLLFSFSLCCSSNSEDFSIRISDVKYNQKISNFEIFEERMLNSENVLEWTMPDLGRFDNVEIQSWIVRLCDRVKTGFPEWTKSSDEDNSIFHDFLQRLREFNSVDPSSLRHTPGYRRNVRHFA